MIDFIFNGTVEVATENKDAFIKDFNKFLEVQKVTFTGTIRTVEFEDAEIIND
ncbi:hypothetical protein [Clostridium sp.]|uniref:hypothetical protein n=1 Tax=Clostridium sp. TaxID=1506 RepID=UPI002FC72AED